MVRYWSFKSPITHSCLLQSSVFKLLFLQVLAVIDTDPILLNSCERCAASKKYEVTSDLGYAVNINPNEDQTCQWECKAHFYSAKVDGWLCLAQVGIPSQINDSNGQMSVSYDSSGQDIQLIKLEYIPSSWDYRESCEQTSFMDFNLRRVNNKRQIDFRNLRLQFNVLDIESSDRMFYLVGTFCDTTYKLLNSQISIYNRPEESDAVMSDKTLNRLCGIPVEMVEAKELPGRRICFLYLPSDQVDCRSNWRFSVSLVGYTLKLEHMAYTLKCSDDRARNIHAWCADNLTNTVTIIFQRDENVPKTAEHPKMFQYILRDYNGSTESLMMDWEHHHIPEMDSSKSNFLVIFLSLMACLVVLICILSVLVYKKQLSVPCKQYGPVHNPGNGNAV